MSAQVFQRTQEIFSNLTMSDHRKYNELCNIIHNIIINNYCTGVD